MSLNSVMRITYVSGWIFAALSLTYRAVLFTGKIYHPLLPASSRGVLFFSCFLFLASMATASYIQAREHSDTKAKGTSA